MIRSSLLLALLLPYGQADVGFARPPKAVREEGGTAITFALSGPADVEVSVADAKGRVVRHLAAGVLGGKNPPPPPLQAGLEQRLVWDGKDDAGREAAGGPFQAVVRAGMKVRFGRMIGGSPYTGSVVTMPYRAPVNGLVADGSGRLFVKMMSSVGSHGNSGMWPWHLREFDRRGEYRKTLLPYPASTPPEKAQGLRSVPAPGAASRPPPTRASIPSSTASATRSSRA